MSVTSKVDRIPNVGGWWPAKETMQKVATTCHFATVYGLFHEAHDRTITFDEYLDFGDPTTFIADLLPQATVLQQSHRIHAAAGLKVKATGALVQAGSVIVFAEGKTNPGHSCIALTSQRVGGYNQTDWFTTAGKAHDHTEHNTVDIPWRTKHLARRFNTDYSLYAIAETTALQAQRKKTAG